MAGICAGLGLDTDASGHLFIPGPRQVSWPNETACRIAANNGLRVDPATGNLWVPPDARMMHLATHGDAKTQVPTSAGTVTLTHLDHRQTAPVCSDCQFVGVLSAGFLGTRMGSGNWWQVDRSITIYVDGTAVGFTGSQPVAVTENNSGGVLGQGGAVDSLLIYATVPAGKVIRLDATWIHNRVTFATAAANGITWRPPSIDGFLYTLNG